MLRKLAIVLVATFVTTTPWQLWWCMAVVALSIFLQLRMRPYDIKLMNNLEAGALVTLLVSLWFSQPIIWQAAGAGENAGYWVLSTLLVVLNVVVGGGLVGYFAWARIQDELGVIRDVMAKR
jgi:hypothetical protein